MKLSPHHVKFVEAYVEEAPKTIYRYYKADSCLVSTRINLEVFKRFHFKDVKTMAVEANIFNPIYTSKGRLPESHEEAEAWRDEGAWQIVVGDTTAEHPHDHWGGHIVTILNNTLLVDLSIASASKPEKDIQMRPILTTVPETFIAGEDKCMLTVNHCMVLYIPRKDNSYQGIKDFYDRERSSKVVSELVETMKWRMQ